MGSLENDTFPHEAIRGRAFSSARGDAFPPSRVAEGHELMGKCITKCWGKGSPENCLMWKRHSPVSPLTNWRTYLSTYPSILNKTLLRFHFKSVQTLFLLNFDSVTWPRQITQYVPILGLTGLTYDLDTLKKRKHSSTSSRLDCEMWNIQTSVI